MGEVGREGERGVEGGKGGEGRGVSDGCLLPFFKRLKRGKGALPSWKSGRQLEKNPVISVPKTHSSAISGSGGNLREPFCFSVLCVYSQAYLIFVISLTQAGARNNYQVYSQAVYKYKRHP